MMNVNKYEKVSKPERSDTQLLLTAVGDVFLPGTVRFVDGKILASDEELGKTVFDKVAPYFQKSDINFCNLEAALSNKGNPQAGRYASFRSYPSMVEVLKKGSIDFVSLANNHSIDYGWEALSDTMGLLNQNGIGFSGGGKNMEEARKPALIEKKGLTIGLLSYTANVNTPFGFKASQEREGLAPMRISPFFLPDHTNQEDVEAMEKDVEKWKLLVDFLIVSFHWGISEGGTHTVALHQKIIAHHAVHAGADLILGHHSHALQAVEIYRNKPICYGLGNFVFALEEGFPRETMIFQCWISRHKVHEVKFLPAYVSKQGQPEVVSPNRGEGVKIVSLMRKLCSRFGTKLVTQKQVEGIILKGKTLAKK
jgi:poly-gamma-glutamate capsule biosynthesis protein CapA/YwtB (metallophosphatase superfamily)